MSGFDIEGDIDDIFRLLESLKTLEFVNLSKNPKLSGSLIADRYPEFFLSLHALYLADTAVSFPDCFPLAAFNKMTCSVPDHSFSCSCSIPSCLKNPTPLCTPLPWWAILLSIILPILAVMLLTWLMIILVRYLKLQSTLLTLRFLPKEITRSYADAIERPQKWTQVTKTGSLFAKTMSLESADAAFPLQVLSMLEGDELIPKNIYAVYNPMLVDAFALTKEKLDTRANMSRDLFFCERWQDERCTKEILQARRDTYKAFLARAELFPWNSDPKMTLPIFATIHGTSLGAAWKICSNGFASLSLVDAGFYGVGMYFTTFAKYALPYFISATEPAIIISYLIPGNTYPATEHPFTKPESLIGTNLQKGYQSHYIRTDTTGMPTTNTDNFYDEIVINQESQVCPAFIIELDSSNFGPLMAIYQRKLAHTAIDSESELTDLEDNYSEGELDSGQPLLDVASLDLVI